jgi:hypothetical protein
MIFFLYVTGDCMSKNVLFILFALLTSCGGGGSTGGVGSGGVGGITLAGTVYSSFTNTTSSGIQSTSITSSGNMDTTISSNSISGGDFKEFATATVSGSTYLYVANMGSNSISEFKVSGTSVTSLGTISTGSYPQCLTVDKSDRFLFVGDSNDGTLGSGDIYSYTINSDGTLTSTGTPAYNASNPVYGISEDETGSYLVAAVVTSGSSWSTVVLTVNANGTLTYSNEQTGLSGGIPFYWAADPSTTHGDFLYSGAWNGSYFYSAVLSGGSVTVTTTTLSGNHLYYPAWIDPTGTWLFMADNNETSLSESLTQYTIGSSGALSAGAGGSIVVNSSSGGYTNALSGYDSNYGLVVFPYGGDVATLSFNSLNGTLSLINSNVATAPGGYMAFVP